MSQQLTAIRKGFQQIGCSDQLPMWRQRRQWLLQSVKPLLQLRINGKPLCELLLQAQGCFQGKDPTPLAGLPTATGANAPELRRGDRIRRTPKQNIACSSAVSYTHLTLPTICSV